MTGTVGDVYRMLDVLAPFALAEEWDNVGILAGRKDQGVTAVLCALDLNEWVIDEAVQRGANLIVTHHPILFRGRKNLCEEDAEGRLLCRLVREGIAHIAAHTNFDNASPGVNDALAQRLELRETESRENGMRVGVAKCRNLAALRDFVSQRLEAPVRCYGEGGRPVRRVAVLGGAGGEFWPQALAARADVLITGEIGHHRVWDAYQSGLCVLEAGHAATELPAVKMLADGLQNAANGVKWNVRIFESEAELFR